VESFDSNAFSMTSFGGNVPSPPTIVTILASGDVPTSINKDALILSVFFIMLLSRLSNSQIDLNGCDRIERFQAHTFII
jgi:hypothetical protein